jgi:hypothetical protein
MTEIEAGLGLFQAQYVGWLGTPLNLTRLIWV